MIACLISLVKYFLMRVAFIPVNSHNDFKQVFHRGKYGEPNMDIIRAPLSSTLVLPLPFR